MTDMVPWAEAKLPPRLRSMIDAARDEQPSTQLLGRSLAAAAAAGAATVVAVHAAGSTAVAGAVGTGAAGVTTKLSGTALFSSILKWGAIGFVGGAVAVGAVEGAQHIGQPSDQQSASLEAPESPPVTLLDPPVAAVRTSAVAPSATASSEQPSAVPPSARLSDVLAEGTLAVEIRIVERARAALRAGRLQQAVVEAQTYAERYPSGQFGPEMSYIRMEALQQQGDRKAAASAARELIKRHPTGPQSLRAQQILADEKR